LALGLLRGGGVPDGDGGVGLHPLEDSRMAVRPYWIGHTRRTTMVILSLPPPSSASANRASHVSLDDRVSRNRWAIRSSDTCRVRPSLHSSTTVSQVSSNRVSSGAA